MNNYSEKIELLNPKSDYVFKRIFGHVGNEEITKELLNSILENKVTEIELDKWIKFLENPEVIKMGENKSVDKAKKILEEKSQDERERYLAELREKYIMDQKAIADAGYDKGIEQGKLEGKKENTIEIAKKLKQMKMSMDDIVEATGLSKEIIEKL